MRVVEKVRGKKKGTPLPHGSAALAARLRDGHKKPRTFFTSVISSHISHTQPHAPVFVATKMAAVWVGTVPVFSTKKGVSFMVRDCEMKMVRTY